MSGHPASAPKKTGRRHLGGTGHAVAPDILMEGNCGNHSPQLRSGQRIQTPPHSIVIELWGLPACQNMLFSSLSHMVTKFPLLSGQLILNALTYTSLKMVNDNHKWNVPHNFRSPYGKFLHLLFRSGAAMPPQHHNPVAVGARPIIGNTPAIRRFRK